MARKKIVEELETPVVEADKSTTIELKVEVSFTDKYTGETYEAGKVYSFSTERAKELLADSRKLVSKI